MKKHILNSIKAESYVHLKPSLVCDGVGVFALRFIKKGTTLFADVVSDTDFTKWDTLRDIDSNVIKYIKSICNGNDSGFYLSRTINNINLAYYVNHSNTPNTHHDLSNDRFVTIRDIMEGEEILCEYVPEEMDW